MGTTLPFTLQPRRIEKLDRKEVGRRIAALHKRRTPVLISTDTRIAFYANAEIVDLPTARTFCEFLDYARTHKVDVIVMNTKRTVEKKRLGRVTRLFFENSGHPALQLLFTYPTGSQRSRSRFHVYRLLPAENLDAH